jgi:hypothetical protein
MVAETLILARLGKGSKRRRLLLLLLVLMLIRVARRGYGVGSVLSSGKMIELKREKQESEAKLSAQKSRKAGSRNGKSYGGHTCCWMNWAWYCWSCCIC